MDYPKRIINDLVMSDLYLEEVPLGLQVQELQEGGNIFVNDRAYDD